MKFENRFESTCPFKDYENYIYLNTTLTRDEARAIARDCWNRGLTKTQALNIAREKQTN